MPVMSLDVCQGFVTIYLPLYTSDTVFTVCVRVAPYSSLSLFFARFVFSVGVIQNMLVRYLWDLTIFSLHVVIASSAIVIL